MKTVIFSSAHCLKYFFKELNKEGQQDSWALNMSSNVIF